LKRKHYFLNNFGFEATTASTQTMWIMVRISSAYSAEVMHAISVIYCSTNWFGCKAHTSSIGWSLRLIQRPSSPQSRLSPAKRHNRTFAVKTQPPFIY